MDSHGSQTRSLSPILRDGWVTLEIRAHRLWYILGQAADVIPGIFSIIEAAAILVWLKPCTQDFVYFVSMLCLLDVLA
jgi:hypothetical protein